MKKTFISIILIYLCCFLSACSNPKNEYSMPDLDNLSPKEQKLYDEFLKEINGELSEEEKALLEEKTEYILAISRDIAKTYIAPDGESYETLNLINRGKFIREDIEYNRIDVDADDVYLKSILINPEKSIYKLYDKNKDEIEDFNYLNLGKFVQNLGPWVSDQQKLEKIDDTTPQRVGTSLELYRDLDSNEPCLSIQNYLGFDKIATVNTKANIVSDNELNFTFEDDGFGHSGSGTLKFISPDNMILSITATKDSNFGIQSGDFNLIKNKI